MRRPLSDPTAGNSPPPPAPTARPALQSRYGTTHYQPMFRSFRAALGRFCARRAAAGREFAPRRALAWLRLGCKFAPSFADTYAALVHLSRALDDRWGAVEAAREATVRFPDHADAWMLLGEALQMVFRQDEALGAFAQAYAAGGGATALWHNAQSLYDAGDHGAADEALNLWATEVPDGHSRLPEARAELRAKAAARAQVQ